MRRQRKVSNRANYYSDDLYFFLVSCATRVHKIYPKEDIEELVSEGWLYQGRYFHRPGSSKYVLARMVEGVKYRRTPEITNVILDREPSKEKPVGYDLEQSDEVARLLRPLYPRERQIVKMYVVDELSATEIGRIFNLTATRVSQIIKESLQTLRSI